VDFGPTDNKFEEKKYDVEEDVENLPEEAAQWAGEKVRQHHYLFMRLSISRVTFLG
jgi:hypothetical protein